MSSSRIIPLFIVINSLQSGGTERFVLSVFSRLDPSKFSVRIFALRSEGALRNDFVAQGLLSPGGLLGLFVALIRTSFCARSSRPILHCFLPQPYLFGASLGLVCGLNACIMSRRSRNHYQLRHPLAAWVERRLHRYVDAFIGNSLAVVQDLLSEGAHPDSVHLIYNGIDPTCFAVGHKRTELRRLVRTQLNIPEDRVLISCIANLFAYKGHADLLEAFALLTAAGLSQTILLLVGRDAGTLSTLQAQAAHLGISDSLSFLGERNDIANLLAATDIGVLASHEEGFSNAVLQGMAAGLPMVVTNVGGNAEAVIDGECGFVVPPRAPLALASALDVLIRDRALRQAMGATARRRVSSSYSLDTCVATHEALYDQLWHRPT
jgi:glycosyltransferase involved in cell wall biosynthesis